MKSRYVIEHYNKEVRRGVEKRRGEEVKGQGRQRKKQRVWTLNRSPHGNKTAREQFGRQIWQRKREKVGEEERKKVRKSEKGKVKRKERRVERT